MEIKLILDKIIPKFMWNNIGTRIAKIIWKRTDLKNAPYIIPRLTAKINQRISYLWTESKSMKDAQHLNDWRNVN